MRVIRRQPRVQVWRRAVFGLVALLLSWAVWSSRRSGVRTTNSGRQPRAPAQAGHPLVEEALPDSRSAPDAERSGAAAEALAKWVELTDVQAVAGRGRERSAGAATLSGSQEIQGGGESGAQWPAEESLGEESGADPSAAEQLVREAPLGEEDTSEDPAEEPAASGIDDTGMHSHSAGPAGGTPLPPIPAVLDHSLRCPPLSRELLQRRARQNTLLLGVMSQAQQDFGLNWLRHLHGIGVDYFVVGAADGNTSTLLANLKVPCFDSMSPAADSALPFAWGQEGWRRMTWHKVLVLDQIVDWGFNVVVSDMDVVWLRDPLPLFEKHPHADVMFSTDGCATENQAGDEGLELHGHMHHNFNTGVYLLRGGPRGAAWVRAWRGLFDSGFRGHDQEGAYQLMRAGDVAFLEEDPRVSTAWEGRLHLGILPTHLAANAHTFMVQRLHEKMGSQPYDVHATWTYNGIGGKRARFRDAMLWYDEPSYYSGPSFVTVDLRVPRAPEGFNEIQENEEMISFHLAAIQGQLHQAYVGMALAVVAGRAFVSPKFQCFCEKIWYAVVHCRVVDAQSLQFPIVCPTDYLFQPDHFADDPRQFGTPLDFREPSFLDNPRTPDEVKRSVLVIKPTSTLGCSDCVEEQQGPGGLELLVPPGLRDQQLLKLLEPYAGYRVWKLSYLGVEVPGQAFGGFACAGAAREFDKRMEHITTDWCCRREEEAAKFGLQDRIREQLHMSPSATFSSQPGLDTSC